MDDNLSVNVFFPVFPLFDHRHFQKFWRKVYRIVDPHTGRKPQADATRSLILSQPGLFSFSILHFQVVLSAKMPTWSCDVIDADNDGVSAYNPH